jgi:hypothetical protein
MFDDFPVRLLSGRLFVSVRLIGPE